MSPVESPAVDLSLPDLSLDALPAAGAALGAGFPTAQFAVVDTEAPGIVRLALARQLAGVLGASYFKVEDLRAEDLVSIAKEHQA